MIYWTSLQDFLSMGGYALYVWGSFGVTAVAMAAEVVLARARHRAIQKEIKEEIQWP